jgi:hypothetical protein
MIANSAQCGAFIDGNDIICEVDTGNSLASEVIAAVNGHPEASLLVELSIAPGNDGTGICWPSGPHQLAGGVDATATPPYVRIAEGFLFIQESAVWKKTALSTL